MSKRLTLVVIVAALLLTGFSSAVYAAVPKFIGFQGRLTDASGKSVTGSKTIIFKIYDASADGTALWTETQTVTLDADGFYNVYLGEVTALNVDFSNARWLQVTIGDETLTPRYRLVPTAYSFYAIRSTSATYATTSGAASSVDWSNIANVPSGLSGGLAQDSIGNYHIIAGTITITELSSNIDASAKGFNADKVDGLHGTQFLRNDNGEVVTSALVTNGTLTPSDFNPSVYNTVISTNNPYWLILTTGGVVPTSTHYHSGLMPANHNSTHQDGQADSIASYYVPRSGGVIYSTNTYSGPNTFTKTVYVSSSVVITGRLTGATAVVLTTSTFAQNADKLDGLNSSVFARLSNANTYTNSNTFNSQIEVATHAWVSGGSLKVGLNDASAKKINLHFPDITDYLALIQNDNADGDGLLIQTQGTKSADYLLGLKANAGSSDVLYARNDGRVGVGTSAPLTKFHVLNGSVTISGSNANLIVAGNAIVNGNLTISATRYFSINGAALNIQSGSISISTAGYVSNDSASASVYGVVPVALPDGSRITYLNVTSYIVSGGGSPGVGAQLIKMSITDGTVSVISDVSHTTMGSFQNTAATPNETVNNQSYNYFIAVRLTNGDTSKARFYGAYLKYLITQPLP